MADGQVMVFVDNIVKQVIYLLLVLITSRNYQQTILGDIFDKFWLIKFFVAIA